MQSLVFMHWPAADDCAAPGAESGACVVVTLPFNRPPSLHISVADLTPLCSRPPRHEAAIRRPRRNKGSEVVARLPFVNRELARTIFDLVQCFLERTQLHPFRVGRRWLHAPEALWFGSDAHRPRKQWWTERYFPSNTPI
jgi:hypothetical protein